jgi:hypothetical protein
MCKNSVSIKITFIQSITLKAIKQQDCVTSYIDTGANPEFQVRGGGALKKIAPNGGRREIFWGISCENSRFYAKE